jgi:riboflavin kinase/FMN adenylyltransferase
MSLPNPYVREGRGPRRREEEAVRSLEWPRFLALSPEEREASAITLGVFDGVHRGHSALIERIVRRGPCPTVVTFRENPKRRVSPGEYGGDLFSLEQKLSVFEDLGVERVILIDFTENFSKMRGRDFIGLLEDRGRLSFMALGANFRCGCGQDTGASSIAEMNRERGIETEIVPQVMEGGEPVSSSRIRRAISQGDLVLAARLLGRNPGLCLGDIIPQGNVFDVAARRRITPPEGSYGVFLFGKTGERVQTRVDIDRGRVILPFPEKIQGGPLTRLEFMTGGLPPF